MNGEKYTPFLSLIFLQWYTTLTLDELYHVFMVARSTNAFVGVFLKEV